MELDLNDSESIGVNLSEYAASGDWRLLFLDRDRVKSVTETDVARVAKAYLKDSNRTVGVFIPTAAPDRSEMPAGPDAATLLKDYKGGAPVSEGEVFVPTAANVEGRVARSKLADGARLALIPKKTRGGSVQAQVQLEFGDEKALFGKAAVAQLTAGMLMRGSKNKTRQQIQDESDRLKARIDVSWRAGSVTRSDRDHRGRICRARSGWWPKSCTSRCFRRTNSRSCSTRASPQIEANRKRTAFLARWN